MLGNWLEQESRMIRIKVAQSLKRYSLDIRVPYMIIHNVKTLLKILHRFDRLRHNTDQLKFVEL